MIARCNSAPSGAVVAECELSDQPASLRTHMLLTIGPCLFTLVSADGFHGGAIDPSRLAARIVTGIGSSAGPSCATASPSAA